MDGFWAFELERRGAGEVVAIDLGESDSYDATFAELRQGPVRPDAARRRRFAIASELLDSRVDYREHNVYDLRPETIGEFDLVVMGFMLQQLRDPLRGLEAVRSVCRGHLLLLDTVSLPLSLLPAPIARLDARRDGSEWFVFNRRGLVKACRLAGFEIEAVTGIIRDRPGLAAGDGGLHLRGRALHALGIRGRSAAIRARALR
jgi:tRNA (mo5U34)-methyltransferase